MKRQPGADAPVAKRDLHLARILHGDGGTPYGCPAGTLPERANTNNIKEEWLPSLQRGISPKQSLPD